ncbi:MAG TPA: VIT domain-containing protein [Kofleriaceae bacterium]
MSALFPTTTQGASSGAELVTLDGRALPLVSTTLTADARGGIARFVLAQRFHNASDERLHVIYRMPLPADGAVSGYAFEIGERTITGVVDKKQQARERFERAVSEGKTAALLEQERQDIFTQQIGNVPAGESIVCKITVDARLVWLPEGEWELRFPTVIGPRYIGQNDTITDAQATHVKVTTQPLGVQVGMALTINDKLQGKASSSTHAIARDANGVISLAAGARLDRDIVVRWPVATPSAGLSVGTARPASGDAAFGLVTIVPPARSAKAIPVARDLIVLLDTSGSMGGIPLDKAKAVVSLIIDTLTERDRFELIEFNNAPHRYLPSAEHATPDAKKAALAWVHSRVAGGGTEIREGVLEAMKTLRIGAQRQVIAVTDGYVGGEQQILRALEERLPASCRLHVLGVGSAVNRSLATALARVGRGAEVIVGPDEDPERSAKCLLDRTAMPMLTNVQITGDAVISHVPAKVPDVFEGAPLVAGVELNPLGGEIIVKGETADGPWEQRTKVLPLSASEGNQAICALYAREKVADLEALSLLETPDHAIEALGIRFQISTRLTSWVAVDETRVHTGPERTENVPQEVPYGTKAQAFGLRAAGSGPILTLGEQAAFADVDALAAPAMYQSMPAPAPMSPSLVTRSMARAGGPPAPGRSAPPTGSIGGPPAGGGGAPPDSDEGGDTSRRRSAPKRAAAAAPRAPSAPPPAQRQEADDEAVAKREQTPAEPSAPVPAKPIVLGSMQPPAPLQQAKKDEAPRAEPSRSMKTQAGMISPEFEGLSTDEIIAKLRSQAAADEKPAGVASAPIDPTRKVATAEAIERLTAVQPHSAYPQSVQPAPLASAPAEKQPVMPAYKSPPRMWLWILLALVLGLVAALAWWFLS